MSRRLLLSGSLLAGALLATFVLAAVRALGTIRLEAETQVRQLLATEAARASERAARSFSDWLGEARARAYEVSDDGRFVNPPEPVPFETVRVAPADPGRHAFYLREAERAEHADGDVAAARGFYRLAGSEEAPRHVRLLALSRAAALAGRLGDAQEASRLWAEVAEMAAGTELLLVAAAEGAPVPGGEVLDALVRHLGAHRDGRVEGYARRLGLAEDAALVSRRRELARMERLRPGLLPVPAEGETRWSRPGSGEVALQSGTSVVVAAETAVREVLGEAARLPGDPTPGGGLSVAVAGTGPLAAVTFVTSAGPEEVAGTVRRQAALLLGALGTAAAVILVALGFLMRGVRREAELARLKSDFVANVSHDLRAPLSVIRLYAETMRTGRVPEGEEEDYAAVVEREAVALSRLVDRVLDFARIERGTRQYRLEPGDLAEFLARFAEEADGRWRGVRLRVRAPEAPVPARFDREALAGALGNLVENAERHGGGGEVVLELTRDGDEARIGVLDRGPGVPPAEAERIFGRFHRGRDAEARAVRGSGLGLTLVRHVAEGHGGAAGHEPRDGGGSRFFLRLPASEEP